MFANSAEWYTPLLVKSNGKQRFVVSQIASSDGILELFAIQVPVNGQTNEEWLLVWRKSFPAQILVGFFGGAQLFDPVVKSKKNKVSVLMFNSQE